MNTKSPWAVERFGRRGARLALIASGVVFMVLVGGWAGLEMASAWHAGRDARAAGIGFVALLLLATALRVMSVNWHAALHGPDSPDARDSGAVMPDNSEQTGIWGVGGPSMREPGSTGTWRPRIVDRRYDSSEE
jgi:hypothetical protein